MEQIKELIECLNARTKNYVFKPVLKRTVRDAFTCHTILVVDNVCKGTLTAIITIHEANKANGVKEFGLFNLYPCESCYANTISYIIKIVNKVLGE